MLGVSKISVMCKKFIASAQRINGVIDTILGFHSSHTQICYIILHCFM